MGTRSFRVQSHQYSKNVDRYPVNDDVVTAYQDLKIGHKYKYCIFVMNDDQTEVVVQENGESDATWDDFCAKLPDDDCRYAVFDFDYTLEDGGQRDKVILVVWAPDSAKIKSKMLYSATKDSLKNALEGIPTEVQATDRSEIEYDVVLERCTRFN